MAVRDDFSAGEVLAAADLNDTFASKLPYSYGTATPTTSDDGFLWFDSNSTPAATKFWDGSAFVPFGGKILQVVRATDGTERSTTSNTFVDASISVTITPQKSDSVIVLIWSVHTRGANDESIIKLQITDNSNNALSGAEQAETTAASTGGRNTVSLIGYSTPATTSATTYKGRFATQGSISQSLRNADMTGQLYAIEVSA